MGGDKEVEPMELQQHFAGVELEALPPLELQYGIAHELFSTDHVIELSATIHTLKLRIHNMPKYKSLTHTYC